MSESGTQAGSRPCVSLERQAAQPSADTYAEAVLDAIYQRRAVRSYTTEPVPRETIDRLLMAAVQAPSAVNQQPWAFVIVQDRALLKRYSNAAKAAFLSKDGSDSRAVDLRRMLGDPGFNVFYNAGTLIVICAGPGMMCPPEDCCLAGQNLMLAAHAMGLGTCPIGLARELLNRPEVKAELGIPAEFSAVLPIIVGFPIGATPPVPRADPRILSWQQPRQESAR